MDSRCRSVWPRRERARRRHRAVHKPGPRSSVFLVRGEAVGAGDVTASDANNQAAAAGPEAKNVHNTQEAVATSHALPSPMDQAT